MDDKYKLSSLDSTLKLIDYMAYTALSKEVGITELSEKLSLGKSTVHRILNTLLDYGYIVRNNENGKYSLGFKFVNVADAILERLDIITVTRTVIESMVDSLMHNAAMVSFENSYAVVIESYPCRNRGYVVYNTGDIFPAYASSAGKLFLSRLSESNLRTYFDNTELKPLTPYTLITKSDICTSFVEGNSQGYFICNQEFNEGIMSFAAPVFDEKGNLAAALMLYGPLSEMSDEEELLTDKLKKTAAVCSQLYTQKL